MSGNLIAFEGISGSGKSTLVTKLSQRLEENGYETKRLATIKDENRAFLKEIIERFSLEPATPAFMFLYQSLHARKAKKAMDAISDDKIVISDRWDLSFFVFHNNFGFFSEESGYLRKETSRLAFRGLRPDLGIYLDVDIDTALERRIERGDEINNLESERSFQQTVQRSYGSLVEERENWTTINGQFNPQEIKEVVWEMVQNIIS
jgi:dTMP kinase